MCVCVIKHVKLGTCATRLEGTNIFSSATATGLIHHLCHLMPGHVFGRTNGWPALDGFKSTVICPGS